MPWLRDGEVSGGSPYAPGASGNWEWMTQDDYTDLLIKQKQLGQFGLTEEKSKAETGYLKKQTEYLGKPKQATTTTSFSGPEPTMGALAQFNMPAQGSLPEFALPEMGEMPVYEPATMGPMPTYKAPVRGATPDFNAPEMGAIPEFIAPEYDEGQISKIAQQVAAPGVRNLRTAVQTATSRRYDNPNVQRMTLRDALAGYGQGLEEVMSGARQSASAEYANKYANEYKAAGMNWQVAVQTVRDKYAGQMESRKVEYQAELDAISQTYSAEVSAEQQRINAETQIVLAEYAGESETKRMEYLTAVENIRTKYAGEMDKRKIEYQADLDMLNQNFLAKLQVEQQRVAAENQKTMVMYESAMQKYLAGGKKTTVEEYI